ncbi:MAG: hypothetical protein HDR88_05990 [Bacteroides sp.]|nr:hypothetical protein [Bacteroides sp.]
MDTLDAITLLYLSKNWDGQGTLLDCAHKFQQTKEELEKLLKDEQDKPLDRALEDGSFTF